MKHLVNIHERVKSLVFPEEIPYGDTIIYEYRGGYEILKHEVDGGGSSEYRGVYHPNEGFCESKPFNPNPEREDGYVCYWCGSTVW